MISASSTGGRRILHVFTMVVAIVAPASCGGPTERVQEGGAGAAGAAGVAGAAGALDDAGNVGADGASPVASCTDGLQNGTETDIDCGGSCSGCSAGKVCSVRADCTQPDTCLSGSCDPITSGLLAHWKMDERTWAGDCSTPTVSDSSGNGNDGIACGGAYAGSPGKLGFAGKFDGTGRVQIPASTQFDYGANDFSIAVWVSLATVDKAQAVYDGLPNIAGHLALVHYTSQYPTAGWTFEQRPISSPVQVLVSEAAVNTSSDAWHHLALVRQGSSFSVLVDAVPVASTVGGTPVMGGTHVNLGWLADSALGLNGMLDDYRIYGRALAPDEIAALAE